MTPHPQINAAKNKDRTLVFAGASTLLMILIGWTLRSEQAMTTTLPAPQSVSSLHEQVPAGNTAVALLRKEH